MTGNDARSPVGLGGGILQSGGSLTLRNSIVAGNVSSYSNNTPDISGTIASSNGHNIFGSDVAGNVAGDLENVATALLFAGGLADNGGPRQTFALRDAADNPVGSANSDDAPATDQRGYGHPGPAGADPDIGAFELGGLPPSEDIVGTPGKNFLTGTGEDDVIRGLAGNDTLWGLAGDDRLFGGNGKDALFGKAGIDQSTGGLGADHFVLRATSEAAPDGPAYDEIFDFNRSQGDKIDLRSIDANEGAPGNQTFALRRRRRHLWPGAAACRRVRRRLPGDRQCRRRSGGRLRHRRAHRPRQLAGRRLFALSRRARLAVAVPGSRPTSLQPEMEGKTAKYRFIVIGLTFLAVGRR